MLELVDDSGFSVPGDGADDFSKEALKFLITDQSSKFPYIALSVPWRTLYLQTFRGIASCYTNLTKTNPSG